MHKEEIVFLKRTGQEQKIQLIDSLHELVRQELEQSPKSAMYFISNKWIINKKKTKIKNNYKKFKAVAILKSLPVYLFLYH